MLNMLILPRTRSLTRGWDTPNSFAARACVSPRVVTHLAERCHQRVRLDKIRLFNAVNAEQGYRTVAIHSPREVTTHGRDDDGHGDGAGG